MGIECAFGDESDCLIAGNCADIAYADKHGELDRLGLDPVLIDEVRRRGGGAPHYACAGQIVVDGSLVTQWGCLSKARGDLYNIRRCPFSMTTKELNEQYPYMKVLLEPLNF